MLVVVLCCAAGCTSADDFIVNDHGHDYETRTLALAPTLAMRTTGTDFLAAWVGDTVPDNLVQAVVTAQRTASASGLPIDATDVAVSGAEAGYQLVRASYSPVHDEYMVVWISSDLSIFAARMSAATGAVSSPVQIGTAPASAGLLVAYNSVDDEYLAVWGRTGRTSVVKGQRIDAATGLAVGPDDFTIPLELMPSGIAFNPTDDQYLMVQEYAPDQQIQIGVVYGVRVAGDGTIVDAAPLTLVPDGGVEVHGPVVSYAPELGRYLLVWSRGVRHCCLGSELRGQFLDHATLATIGTPGFLVDQIAAPSTPFTGAYAPQVTWDAGAGQFVVAFFGSDATGGQPPGSDDGHVEEVFVQRVAGADGAIACPNAFRVSDRNATTNVPDNRPEPGSPLALGVAPSTGQGVVLWRGTYTVVLPGFLDSDVYGDSFPRGCSQ